MTGNVIELESRPERFAPGDVVRLRSGSPYMTVVRCADGLVDLMFWNDDEFHSMAGVPDLILQRIEEADPSAAGIPLTL